MTRFRTFAVAALAVAIASPAFAANERGDGVRRGHAYDAGVIYHAPPPGFGVVGPYDPPGLGPYDDGNYVRGRREWMRLPPSAHGG